MAINCTHSADRPLFILFVKICITFSFDLQGEDGVPGEDGRKVCLAVHHFGSFEPTEWIQSIKPTNKSIFKFHKCM